MLTPTTQSITDAGRPDAVDAITSRLTASGLVLLAGLTTRSACLRVAHGLMRLRTHRDSDPDGATVIEQRLTRAVTGSLAGFTDRELHPHTEGTAVPEPPGLLFLACLRPAETGGASVLVDGAAVYADIAADPDMREALSTPRSAYFGGPAGHLGAVFSVQPGGRVEVRLRFDDMIRLAPAAALYRDKLRTLVRRHEITVDLAAGEGYVLLNDRWLHGRTRYQGPRQMLRLIGDPHPHLGLLPGFAAPVAAGSIR